MRDNFNKWSLYGWILCAVMMCYASLVFYPRYKQLGKEAPISWDVSGYYWYLPSIFIYHDIKHQSFKDSVLDKYQPTGSEFMQGYKLANGDYVMKYSSGMAVMYSPFFLTAHAMAGWLGYPRDGFSLPYQLAIQLGGLLISLIGLWHLRKLSLLFYNDVTVAITLLLLVAGTNYLELSGIDCGMSHTWLFTLYVFLLLNTYYFYDTGKTRYAIRIGLLVGLATLTRPTDIISGLIPLLWGMENPGFNEIKKKLRFIRFNIKPLLLAVFCAAMIIAIQPLYWKYVSGHWLVYSYGDQGFSFRHPFFSDYTFSYRSGWLIYTPLMMFAFVGIIPFLFRGRNKMAILAFFLLNYYIVSSWSVWNYGGRAMVQSYPILLFPIAALVDVILLRMWSRFIMFPVALFMIYMNVWITYHHHMGDLYDFDAMTYRYYWRVVGRWSAPENTVVLRDNTDLFEGTPRNERLLYQNDFERDTNMRGLVRMTNGNHVLLVNGKDRSLKISIPFNGGEGWIRVRATFHCDKREPNQWNMTQFVARLKKNGEQDETTDMTHNMLRVQRLLREGQDRDISLDMKLPKDHYDSLQVWLDNRYSDNSITMDNIKIWSFNE